MRLQKRIIITLVPMISVIVIVLAMTSWQLLFDQSRLNEINRAKLALKIATLNVDKAVSEIDSALSKAGEYSQAFSLALGTESAAKYYVLNDSFIEFSYQLSSQVRGFDHSVLLDSDLNVLSKVSLSDLINFTPSSLELSAQDSAAINNLHSYMVKNILTQGIISFKSGQGLFILGARAFSPYVPEGANLTWGNEHYMVGVFTKPFGESIVSADSFNITPSGAVAMSNISSESEVVLRSYNLQDDLVSSNTPLFTFDKVITRKNVDAGMRDYIMLFIGLSIVLIVVLLVVVNYVLRKSVLTPIAKLERKVVQSVETGKLDILPSTDNNEIASLGNQYLNLVDQIFSLANIDSLTNLPNRHQFISEVSKTLDLDPNRGYVLFYLDLDRFKQVNDFYGHAEGDLLLQSFANELAKTVNRYMTQPHDSVNISRLAGDEFAVFTGVDSLACSVAELAENMVRELGMGFTTRQGVLHLEVSLGVALYPDHAQSAENLVARADEAMFEAKILGRNRWMMLDDSIVRKNEEKKEIQEAIEESIANDQFYLVYQPVFLTENELVIGAETLLRSTHPVLMRVGTQAFINIAEKNGSIRRIDVLVASMAMERLAQLRQVHPKMRLSINFSASELVSPDYVQTLKDLLLLYDIPASAFSLEVTETQLTEFGEQALCTMAQLHELGFGLSLDDFGTGYNSFVQLNSSFVSTLKIDKRFIQAINTDSQDANMVNIILGMGKLYGLHIVAEGVETKEQLAYLRDASCLLSQGYLLAKPMGFDEFLHFMEGRQLLQQSRKRLDS
jgi:diguanylate cyclase (GGDEF)-like protein